MKTRKSAMPIGPSLKRTVQPAQRELRYSETDESFGYVCPHCRKVMCDNVTLTLNFRGRESFFPLCKKVARRLRTIPIADIESAIMAVPRRKRE